MNWEVWGKSACAEKEIASTLIFRGTCRRLLCVRSYCTERTNLKRTKSGEGQQDTVAWLAARDAGHGRAAAFAHFRAHRERDQGLRLPPWSPGA